MTLKQQIAGEVFIQSAIAGQVPRISDGDGLYLLCPRGDGRYGWRFDFTLDGFRKTLSLGVYPAVSLEQARITAEQFRAMVANGENPSDLRKKQRLQRLEVAEAARRVAAGEPALGSFEEVARRWLDVHSSNISGKYSQTCLRRMENHVFPYVGKTHIAKLSVPAILAVCRRVEDSGKIDTATRVRKLIGSVMRFAVCEGLIQSDPTSQMSGAMKVAQVTHRPAILDPAKLRELLQKIDGYKGSYVTRCALQLLPLLFVRPGELREARWEEFDLDNGWWRIPAARMKPTKANLKNREPHRVPLAAQAIKILEELFLLTGSTGKLFPGSGKLGEFLSENTLNSALRRLGYCTKTEVCAHGFRATARTLIAETLGFDVALVELQLDHVVQDTNDCRSSDLEARMTAFTAPVIQPPPC